MDQHLHSLPCVSFFFYAPKIKTHPVLKCWLLPAGWHSQLPEMEIDNSVHNSWGVSSVDKRHVYSASSFLVNLAINWSVAKFMCQFQLTVLRLPHIVWKVTIVCTFVLFTTSSRFNQDTMQQLRGWFDSSLHGNVLIFLDFKSVKDSQKSRHSKNEIKR